MLVVQTTFNGLLVRGFQKLFTEGRDPLKFRLGFVLNHPVGREKLRHLRVSLGQMFLKFSLREWAFGGLIQASIDVLGEEDIKSHQGFGCGDMWEIRVRFSHDNSFQI